MASVGLEVEILVMGRMMKRLRIRMTRLKGLLNELVGLG